MQDILYKIFQDWLKIIKFLMQKSDKAWFVLDFIVKNVIINIWMPKVQGIKQVTGQRREKEHYGM